MVEKYYTPEQLEYLKERAREVGAERIKEVETAEWPTLIAEVRAAMDRGTDPLSPEVQSLARRGWLWYTSSPVATLRSSNRSRRSGTTRSQSAAWEPSPCEG